MGLNTEHALTFKGQFYGRNQTALGTLHKWVGADGARGILDFAPDDDRNTFPRTDRQTSTREYVGFVAGKTNARAKLMAEMRPSGSLGVAPDLGWLYKAGIGVQTLNPGVDVQYSLSQTQGIHGLCQAAAIYDTGFCEIAEGWFIEQLRFHGSGDDVPTIEAEGPCRSAVRTGNSTIPTGVTGVTQTVAAGTGPLFPIGSLVAFTNGTIIDDNSGAGYRVDNQVGDVLTLDTSVTTANGDQIYPFMPAQTVVGAPTDGITGSFLIDGVAVPIIEYDIILKNNFKAHHDEVFQRYLTDYHEGRRALEGGSFKLRMRKDLAHYAIRRGELAFRDLQWNIGVFTFDLDYCVLDFSDLNRPQEEEIDVTIPIKRFGSGSGENSFLLTITG